jgi:hypothetical protein
MACRANQIFSQRDIATAGIRNATAFESVGARNDSTEEQRQNTFNCEQFVTPASRAIAAPGSDCRPVAPRSFGKNLTRIPAPVIAPAIDPSYTYFGVF